MSKGPDGVIPMKLTFEEARSFLATDTSSVAASCGVIVATVFPSSCRVASSPVVEADHADMDICTGQNPVPVRLSAKKMSPVSFIRFKHLAVGSSTNALGRQQARPLALALFNQLAGLLKPVAAKVRLAGNPVAVDVGAALQRMRRQAPGA